MVKKPNAGLLLGRVRKTVAPLPGRPHLFPRLLVHLLTWLTLRPLLERTLWIGLIANGVRCMLRSTTTFPPALLVFRAKGWHRWVVNPRFRVRCYVLCRLGLLRLVLLCLYLVWALLHTLAVAWVMVLIRSLPALLRLSVLSRLCTLVIVPRARLVLTRR